MCAAKCASKKRTKYMEQTPNTRKFHIKENPENVLYQAWKEADASARPQIEQNLLTLLRRHAAKVCWLVLHYHSDHLIEEIVEDAIINLPKFNGLSLFSTWFHACAMGTARVALRKQIRRKEVPVNEVLSMPNEPKDPEKDLFIREIKERLNDSDRRLFDL